MPRTSIDAHRLRLNEREAFHSLSFMTQNHLTSHIKHSDLKSDSTLHVIGVIQNPVRYHSRYRLFQKWVAEMCAAPNVKLYVVEAVYGDRHPECAPTELNYQYKAVQVSSEIWLKENLINIAIKQLLPADWKYVAWVDCDVHFRNPTWANATIHQLQHYNILQPWSHAIDLDFYGGVYMSYESFGYLCARKVSMDHGKNKGKPGYHYAHTGYAWACTRYFYENVEKLLDFCPVGAGDHHMGWGCLGKINETIHQNMVPDYYDLCDEWGRKAKRACAGIVGYVNGTIEHGFHGPKERRRYWGRWQILEKHRFNPKTDIAYDSQGVMIFVGQNKYQFEHDIMLYNRERLEDSIEMY